MILDGWPIVFLQDAEPVGAYGLRGTRRTGIRESHLMVSLERAECRSHDHFLEAGMKDRFHGKDVEKQLAAER